MWRATRVLAVTAAAVAWVVLGSYALFELGVGEVTFEPESDFSAALNDARIAAWRQDPAAPLPAVCGFPGVSSDASFQMAHDDVVNVARCLNHSGHLPRIEHSEFGIAFDCPGEPSPPGQVEIESTECLIGYPGAQARGHPWLPSAIMLASLRLVVWFVGFGLPWPPRSRPMQTFSDRRGA